MIKVNVINRALRFLGERNITNPDAPETPAGRSIVNSFDDCRREVIRRHPWNFAETWVEIDKTTAPPFGYADAYAFPEDCVRLLVVGEYNSSIRDYRLLNQGAPDYRKVIALNNGGAAKLKIAYAADIQLLSLWDPLALKVLALWLAMDHAKGITGQNDQVKLLNDLLTEELKDAIGVDGQEQPMRRHEDSYVQRERDRANFGGGSGWTNVEFY